MKRLLVLFTVLAVTFAGTWIYKLKNPENRPDSYKNGLVGNYWWNSIGEAEEDVNTNWRLSEGVPNNYIPVPGKTNLYMVVDDEGYITGYKRHIKNDETGEWSWEDVNPDIPENYEAVPNLKDVYKVTYDDGSVRYFKYVRNKDDTYAFVEVDAKGNMIGYEDPQGSEIPDNYVRVNKNQYAVKNNDGITIAFKERVVDPTSSSGFKWEDIDEEDISVKTASALDSSGFNLDTDITGLGDGTGGNRPYYQPSSGSDINITYSIPTLMPQQETVSSSNNGNFVFTQPSKETIITEQIYVTAPPMGDITVGNYNTGNYTGSNTGGQGYTIPGGNESGFISEVQGQVTQTGGDSGLPTMPPYTGTEGASGSSGMIESGYTGDAGSMTPISQSQSGYVISRETLTTREQVGNDIVTYQEIIEKTYDANGNELQSRSLGKTEIGRESMTASSGADNIASTIGEEYDRIVNLLFSKNGQFDANTPKRLRELINNARMENGKQILEAPGSNDAIYKIALARASMMALTGSSSKDLPSYGSLRGMCSKYGVSINTASENMLVISSSSAESIHAMLISPTSELITSENYSHVAIAIATMNGKMYICEIFY